MKERAVIAREGPTASATGVGVSREMLVCQEGETLQVIVTEHLRAQCAMRFLSPGADSSLPRAPAVHSHPFADAGRFQKALAWSPPSDNGALLGNEFLSFSASRRCEGGRAFGVLQSRPREEPLVGPKEVPSLPEAWRCRVASTGDVSGALGGSLLLLLSQGRAWRDSQCWLPGLAGVSPCKSLPPGTRSLHGRRRRHGKRRGRPHGPF